MNESILETVHETAQGLHKAGAMDTTMREFDLFWVAVLFDYLKEIPLLIDN